MEVFEEIKQAEDDITGRTPLTLLPPTQQADSVSVSVSPPIDLQGAKSMQELLPDILLKCYEALVEASSAPKHISKYVDLSELGVAVKARFREETAYEFDITELDYVCFKQLLMMEFASTSTLNIKLVHCDKQLMCTKRGDKFEPKYEKIRKNNRDYNPCAEIETYVVIRPVNPKENNGENKPQNADKQIIPGANNNDADDDDNKEDEEILTNIRFLDECNIVGKLTHDDVYYHIKLLHSNCSVLALESEINRSTSNGMAYHHGMNMPEATNSYDEVANALRDNEVNGERLLNMKWSAWEMVHELNRSNDDHQDFIEDITFDFFFPFQSAEQLSNQIFVTNKPKRSMPSSLFDDMQIRSKITLCVDYGLFPSAYPILHHFVKIADLEDFRFLLKVHTNLSVDRVVGDYNAMHVAAWKGKFELLAAMTEYGGDPLVSNKQEETAFEAGRKYPDKLKWFAIQFPRFKEYMQSH